MRLDWSESGCQKKLNKTLSLFGTKYLRKLYNTYNQSWLKFDFKINDLRTWQNLSYRMILVIKDYIKKFEKNIKLKESKSIK